MVEHARRMPRYRRTALIIALAVGAACAAIAPQSAGALDADDGEIVIRVVEDGSTPSPSPTVSRPAPGAPSPLPGRGGTGSNGGQGVGAGPGDVSDGGAGGADDPSISLPGKPVGLAVSGITSGVAPTIEIVNGELTMSVVVRNTSDEAYSAEAEFRMANVFGMQLRKKKVDIGVLEPGKAVKVEATLDDPGQSVFINGTATIIPPTSVGGVELEPVSRDAFIFVPPLFSLLVLVLAGAAGWATWWFVRSTRARPVAASGVTEEFAS